MAASDIILVLNAGSSSIKFAVYRTDALELVGDGQVEGIGVRPHFVVRDASRASLADEALEATRAADHRGAIGVIRDWLVAHRGGGRLAAVGHRVVHGGDAYARPVLIDDAVLTALVRLIPLAPLHQPHHLAAIRAVRAALPELPQIACFDTAFHRTQPAVAQSFALPREITAEGVRRYGFHGLSYEYIASMLPELAPPIADRRVVVAHLGNGASLCAMRGGRSVATTMGFTALDGLPMGTRCGAIDPGVVLYLMEAKGMSARDVEALLYKKSGLLGVSGLSSDMRVLLASDDPRAREAIDLFVYQTGRALGSLAAALGGLDGIVFTAGIGEHSHEIRELVCRDATWLGVRLDRSANRDGARRISAADSAVSAWIIPTDENLMIARHTRAVLDKSTA
jgi:acetate kinase